MYASRYSMKNLVIGGLPGGALATSHKVENYPGVLSASGKEIMDDFKAHAVAAWSDMLEEMVTEVNKHEDHFHITTATGKEFKTKFVVLATGNNYRHLGAKGEEEMLGKWVSYCATCDGNFFKGRDVVLAWWWNTALTEALYLAELCNKVTIVHRRDTFRAEDIWVEQAKKVKNIEFALNEEVEEIKGKFFVEEILLKSGKTIKADGIFVAIGSNPNTSLVDSMNPEKDSEGCLVVDARQETSIKGLFAAGDVTTNSNKFKQTIMSAAEGCLAADSIHEEILRG
jgi:thioredoxin reductase (NADPH)